MKRKATQRVSSTRKAQSSTYQGRLSGHRSLDADKIASIVLNVEDLQDVSRRGFAGSESTVNASIGDHGTMLSSELKTRAFVFLQRLHHEFGFIAYLVRGIGTKSGERARMGVSLNSNRRDWRRLTLGSTSSSPRSRAGVALCMVPCEEAGTKARRTCRLLWDLSLLQSAA